MEEYDDTFYGALERFHTARRRLWADIRYAVVDKWWWLKHALLVHVFRMQFCKSCSGYFGQAIGIHNALGDEIFCESCYERTFGEKFAKW